MQQFHVLPGDTYNMDEKGFAIGVAGRSKRVFSKGMYERGGCCKVIQDGNQEWITILAAICADGSALPPGVIYPAAAGAIYNRWVSDIEAGNNPVLITSSPSGWTNNDIGLAWLEQVFDRYTKDKAGLRH